MDNDKKIDWISFGTCVALLLGICIPLAAFPGKGGAVLQDIYNFIANELGIFYLLATQYIGNLWPFAICLILVGLSNDFMMAPSWATAQDIGRRYSAIVSGAMNMVGNLGATLGITFTGRVEKAYTVEKFNDVTQAMDKVVDAQGYVICFTIYAAVYFCGVIAWLFIDAEKPILTDEEIEANPHSQPENQN